MRKPLVALVGRPNVGKSTLFNRLVGERLAVVDDTPGTTRDRLQADCEWGGVLFTVIDTGGIEVLPDRVLDRVDVQRAKHERIVDLLPIIKAHYYHPAMRGSFSIKAVLPTVAPHLSYDGLGDVKDGTAAQAAFEEAISEDTEPSRRLDIEQQLLAYCALDTLAMVELVRFLSRPAPFA